ncbi:MAG TPA: hypothetical protein VLS93_19220 [Anaeromyxobacteraceae bacterium]|nr:hypothetical protein [Anaeromyxobacteraceae bacterium]
MRFLVAGGSDAVARARAPVRVLLAFGALALAAFAVQRTLQGGLLPSGVEARYLAGGEPMPPAALWEELHAGAFLYGFLLFLLASILAASPAAPRLRAALLGVAFAATVADLLAPFAVVAAGGGGIVRVATFVAAVGALAIHLAVSAMAFGRAGRNGRA